MGKSVMIESTAGAATSNAFHLGPADSAALHANIPAGDATIVVVEFEYGEAGSGDWTQYRLDGGPVTINADNNAPVLLGPGTFRLVKTVGSAFAVTLEA